jgi:integrase
VILLHSHLTEFCARVRRKRAFRRTLEGKVSNYFEYIINDADSYRALLAGANLEIPLCRQRCDQFMKRYCRLATIHRRKAHFHAFKHSIAMAIWAETKQPGQIKSYLGHKSMSSTMQYLNESDSQKAQEVVCNLNY